MPQPNESSENNSSSPTYGIANRNPKSKSQAARQQDAICSLDNPFISHRAAHPGDEVGHGGGTTHPTTTTPTNDHVGACRRTSRSGSFLTTAPAAAAPASRPRSIPGASAARAVTAASSSIAIAITVVSGARAAGPGSAPPAITRGIPGPVFARVPAAVVAVPIAVPVPVAVSISISVSVAVSFPVAVAVPIPIPITVAVAVAITKTLAVSLEIT